jgi:hypothetical protein
VSIPGYGLGLSRPKEGLIQWGGKDAIDCCELQSFFFTESGPLAMSHPVAKLFNSNLVCRSSSRRPAKEGAGTRDVPDRQP